MRTAVSWISLILFAIALPLSIVSVWIESTIFDQDQFVETLAPLAKDEAMQTAVSVRLTQIATDQLASNRITALRGNSLEPIVTEAVDGVVTSDAFPALWEGAVRVAQPALVSILEGDDTSDDGALIVIDLTEPLDQIQTALEGRGLAVRIFDSLRPEQETLTIARSNRLVRVHKATDFLHTFSAVLPVVVLVAFGLAVGAAHNRWRVLRRIGFATILSMLVLGGLLILGRTIGLNQTANELQRGAAEAVFDALTAFLRTSVIAMVIGGVVISAVAWWIEPKHA